MRTFLFKQNFKLESKWVKNLVPRSLQQQWQIFLEHCAKTCVTIDVHTFGTFKKVIIGTCAKMKNVPK